MYSILINDLLYKKKSFFIFQIWSFDTTSFFSRTKLVIVEQLESLKLTV